MKSWEQFEIACVEYLNNKFGNYAKFTHTGGANSTIPDIMVQTHSGNTFYMEAKLTPAQCGQFVLFPEPETNSFVYSPKNATPLNPFSQEIMRHMEKDFETYQYAGTTGVPIQFRGDADIFANWITNTYTSKQIRFFITNDFVIFPLQDFSKHFFVSALYREKRSGSSSVGKRNFPSILHYIFTEADCGTLSHFVDDDKLFIVSSRNLDKQKFSIGKKRYMFSAREHGFEIRKLSNTANANVIFSIQKQQANGLSDGQFIHELRHP